MELFVAFKLIAKLLTYSDPTIWSVHMDASGNNYNLEALGLDRETAIIKTTSPIKLAQEAKKVCKSGTIIAGGIGPLSDRPMGCFYPDYLNELTINELMEWHEERFKLYVDSECDILAIESIPGIKEIEALLNLLTKYPKGEHRY